MAEILTDVALATIALLSGVVAVTLAVIAARAVWGGQDAYRANRTHMLDGIKKAFMGRLKDESPTGEKRTSHGLAIDLKTLSLISQQRLSTEAVDDVIGRQT